jgi:hypothetical protein
MKSIAFFKFAFGIKIVFSIKAKGPIHCLREGHEVGALLAGPCLLKHTANSGNGKELWNF